MNSFLKPFCLFVFVSVFLISCDKKNDIDPYENSFFYFKNKPFTIESINVTNLGYQNGKYTMEANLTGKNNTKIYIKYFSLTGDKYSCCSLNFGGDPIEKGNAPGEFTQDSYIMINDSVYHLKNGWVHFYNNTYDDRTFEISTDTESDHLMGQSKGDIEFEISPEGNKIDSTGTGWMTYLTYTDQNRILLSNVSMYYSGYDTKKQCYVYKLFLLNEKKDCLYFRIYSPYELKTGAINGIEEINMNNVSEACFSDLYSELSITEGNVSVKLENGNISISKDGENYIVKVNCTDHYYLIWNPVKCYYKGKLYFTDMTPLE